MAETQKPKLRLEIAHVLFIDIVGYSKLRINEQSAKIEKLREIVRATEQFRSAEAEGKLLRLPTGDGGALAFRNSPEAPVLCAVEIAQALKNHPELPVRMGVHSGPVNEVTDLNEQANIAGAGINIAQRIMDCGDAGHILVSKHAAEDLEQYDQWEPYLHDLGPCEVKHGERLHVVNLYNDEIGNSALPTKFKDEGAGVSAPVRPGFSTRSMAAGVLGFIVILALLALLWVGRDRSARHAEPSHVENAPPASQPAPSAPIPEKSVAVLPFDNLSDDKSNAYFAEGIQDEILTRLSKIAALKVISRSSTQKYKSAPDNLRDVGKQLGVAHILEGSVQKIANAVHVNVQLIRAATDEHLWAESYDRKLDDVFAVEGEVASTIANQLNTKLSGTEQKAVTEKPTQNTAAYDAYLRGLAIEHNQYSYESFQQAARDYVEAVQLDPNFAFAWARLSVIRSFLYFNAVDPNTNTAGAVKEAADRAIALAPEAGESWIAQGAYRYRVLRDFDGAVSAYKQAQVRSPNNAYLLQNLAFVQRRIGLWQEAETTFKKALELDPRDFTLLGSLGGEFYIYLRRFDDARAAIDRALEISPDSASARASKAGVFQSEGRLDEAAQELARIPADATDDFVVSARIGQAIYERHFDTAISVIERKLQSLPAGQPMDSINKLALVQLGFCQQWTGRDEDARRSFSRAIEAIKPNPDAPVPPDANGTPNTLALAYAGLGEKEKALEQAQRAVKDYDTDAVDKPQAQATLAQIQARFGDHEAAIAALPHLLEVPAGVSIANLKLDPFWDPLRKDPRFQKLIGNAK
jgi:TolB-like protein/class 3 adenylate cyclase/Flp pilus assembly protein TadD